MENEQFLHLIDKLKFQVTSFQEEFSVLSSSENLTEMGRTFHHILRGNLLLNDVSLFHKSGSDWNPVYLTGEESKKKISDLVSVSEINLQKISGSDLMLAVSIPLIDHSHFGLIIGRKLDGSDFSDTDEILLRFFLQLLDHSYQSFLNQKKEKQFAFELNHRLSQLNNLIDTGIEISKLKNHASLFETSIQRAVSITNASFGILQISEYDQVKNEFTVPDGLPSEIILSSENKIFSEIRFQNKTYTFTLAEKESRTGSVPFETTDQILLDAFARQVYAALENEFLHEETLEIATIKKELSVAADIQKKIIPEKLPRIEGYDLAGINIPSKEVGGDYYDCFAIDDEKFAFVMADVAGKGVPASLLVSTLNASLYAYISMNMPLNELAEKLNKIIYKSSPSDKFITFMVGILEPKSGKFSFVNAGHNPGFILRNDNSLYKLEAGGIPLGMMDAGIPFEANETVLNSGEKLLLYTDGIPEAMNEESEEYSDEKLELFFSRFNHTTADYFISNMIHEIKNYAGSAPQSDDITILYLSRS